ncbi:MAG: hypothetical protein KME09_02970 [Pleurocapsa minor HA4230-MV1]|jgi:hypothetical protein|nr:hypothetical protein [Pleurocapsa minor HA4230-MV1]
MGDKDFFLDPDDAMTMGDINYMRTSRRTRRTFPKTLKNKDGFAFENEVSSIENRNNLYKGSNTNQDTTVNTIFNPTPSSQSQPGITGGSAVTQTNPVREFTPEIKPLSRSSFDAPKPSAEKRRPSGDSMDMFRNMAKNIGRK